LSDDLKELYSDMISAELKYRPTIDELLIKFKVIIDKNGLLIKYNKHIKDNLVVDLSVMDESTLPARPIETESEIFKKVTKPNPDILLYPNSCYEHGIRKKGKCLKKEKVSLSKIQCPIGKERNPKTRRCIKICKEGYNRNDDFKCVKNKTKKSTIL